MPTLRLAVAPLLAILALAGCGGDDEEPTAAPTPAPATTASYDGGLELIEDGDAVSSRRSGGRLVATVTVRGRAPVGSRVSVRARCDARACSTTAVAAPRTGRFTAEVRAESEPDARSSFVDVRVGGERSTILVTFKAPKAAKRKPAPPAPSRTAQPEPEPAPRDLPDPDEDEVPELAPGPDIPTQPQTIPAPSTGSGLPQTLHLVGDSLAVGTAPRLRTELRGWNVTDDSSENRTLAEGMARGSGNEPSVLAYSLFTNDPPDATAALRKAVRDSVKRVPPRGCVIWATIVRPPAGGQGPEAANALLRRLAAGSGGRIRVADWARAVADNPSWLAEDGVHGTPAGYAGRAELYAAAARRCIR